MRHQAKTVYLLSAGNPHARLAAGVEARGVLGVVGISPKFTACGCVHYGQADDQAIRKTAKAAAFAKASRLPGTASAARDGDGGGLVLNVADADAAVRKRLSGGAASMARMTGRLDREPHGHVDEEAAIDVGVAL